MELLKNYKDYLTVNDLYAILPIGKNKIYELIKSGQLKGKLIGRKYVVSKVNLFEFIDKEN